MIYALLIMILIFLTLALVISVKKNFELDDKLDALGEQIEISLDVLDDCYNKIGKVLDTPVGSDDPIVRELLNDIKRAQGAVLEVANRLVSHDQENDDEDEDEEKSR